MARARDKHKGSDRDTLQKQLTDNQKRLYHTTEDTSPLQLTVLNQIVTITNNHAIVVSMPSVVERPHVEFKISIVNDGNAVTLTDFPNETYNDGVSWGGDYTLDTAGDSITLKSNESSWEVVSNDIV